MKAPNYISKMQEFYHHLSKVLPSLKDRDCIALYEQLQRVSDPFNAPVIWPIPSFSNNINGLHKWLPISTFKHSSDFWFRGKSPSIRTFRSSGTTSEERSLSQFSEDGLILYQESSVALFKYVLEATSGKNLESFKAISLIPPVHEWPDSSLAQMIEWIGRTIDIEYVAEDKLLQAVESSDKPVWIFGTGFHFINVLDSHSTLKLPAGSLVIETGGTKGRSREVVRSEFYNLISEKFHIETDHIISEYGMCELASQAYDFVPYHQKDCIRRFRFAKWVMLQVCDNKIEPLDKGKGALLVHDSLRVDYPYPLRTDDMANLDAGCFFLEGRIAQAQLKGCSLHAEKIVSTPKTPNQSYSPPTLSKHEKSTDLATYKNTIISHLSNAGTIQLLANDIGSLKNAEYLLAQLAETIALADLKIAADAANPTHVSGRVLLVLPENHSVVGLYPLILGAISDFDLVVRIPRKYSSGFLPNFIEMLNSVGGIKVQKLHHSFLITENNSAFERIIIYGTNQTVKNIEGLTKTKVVGFGDALSICDLRHSKLSPAILSDVALDSFSLGQSGCMSTRLIVASSDFTTRMADIIAAKGQYHWNSRLDLGTLLAIDNEYFRYQNRNFYCSPKKIEPLVVVKKFGNIAEVKANFFKIVSKHSFCLPIVLLDNTSDEEIQSLNFDLKLITNSNPAPPTLLSINEIEFRAIGQAQNPPFNGLHQNKPLFN